MEVELFQSLNENRLKMILKKYRVTEKTWWNIVNDYFNWDQIFYPQIIDDVDDEPFIVETDKIFDFKKSWTVKSRKDEFKQWLKHYWSLFWADCFTGILEKITTTLAIHHQQYPGTNQIYISWMAAFGGIIAEPNQFPDEAEIAAIQASGCNYLLPLKVPPKKNDDDMIINPEDIPDE
jgi:hypothetical protein